MCGLNLIISKNQDWKEQKIRRMMEISNKRGPDNNDVLLSKDIALGHNLLAITESSIGGLQPWYFGRINLAFNGEIYNYKEIREKQKEKYNFHGNSDTEVLLRGLADEGIQFLSKVDGMYAIIYWDEKDNSIWMARDPSGCKPLYYIQTSEYFAASSMIECLLELEIERKIDEIGYNLYRIFGFVSGPRTLYKNIKKLIPGEIIQIDVQTKRIKQIYYNKEKIKEQSYNPEELREKISLTVRDCLIGRRKVGLYLSGGLDSSIILTEALKYNSNIETFTTRFQTNNPQDDTIFNSDANIAARYAANLGVNHHELLVTVDDFIDAVEPCIKALEEPRSNPNTPAYYLLNKFSTVIIY